MNEQRTSPWSAKRWLKRAVWTVLALGIIVVIGHVSWTLRVRDSVEDKVAALRAAGEPMLIEDLPKLDIPDDQNAAVDLKAAGEMLAEPYVGAWKAYNELNVGTPLPLSAEHRRLFREVLTERSAALEKVKVAKAKAGVDWQLNFKSPLIETLDLKHLSGQPAIATLLSVAAKSAHAEGRHDEAVARIMDQLWHADLQVKQPTLIVTYLSMIGCSGLTCSTANDILPDLRIGNQAGNARQQQVRELINALLDERVLRKGYADAWKFERLFVYDSFMSVVDGDVGTTSGQPLPARNAGLANVLMPLYINDVSALLDHQTGLIEAVRADNLQKATFMIPTDLPEATAKRPYLHLFSSILQPSIERSIPIHYRAMTDRRLTATALALRLYALEHDGQLPPDLETLVPDYLPAVPVDTLHGKALVYKPDGPFPMVYSVGENGQDEGGTYSSRWRWSSRKGEPDDIPVDLVRRPPATQPAQE